MTGPPRQLTLDWPHQPSFEREDFLSAPSNREALSAIDQWPAWPGRMLLLIGPEGAGKSHLAALWARTAGAATFHAEALLDAGTQSVGHESAMLIENADRVGAAEHRLFHLLNAGLQANSWVLLTARKEPNAWGLRFPDILSRLRLAPLIRLKTPDIELTEAVLFKLFSDRQLLVEPQVVAFIAMRIERSLGAARRLVESLDREALASGRRVTRAMASELMREISLDDESP